MDFLIKLTNTQYVIFESIGQMAGAILYQHAKLSLNLSSIFYKFERFKSSLQSLKYNLSAIPPPVRLNRTFVGDPPATISSIITDTYLLTNLKTYPI
jgi:hypothetical protein